MIRKIVLCDPRLSATRSSLFLAAVLLAHGCSGGGGGVGPDPEEAGLLHISAADLDGSASGAAPAGFALGDVSSFRVQLNAGPRIVIDSTFVGTGAFDHAFLVEEDTYLILIEAYQGESILVFTGVGQATIPAGDTVAVQVDLDPSLGTIEAAIDGKLDAQVATNGSAPVRVVVRNTRGQPVAGAAVELSVDPPTAATIDVTGPPQTDADGVFEATFVSLGGEASGELRMAVDGFPVSLANGPFFTIVSPVDVALSTVALGSTERIPADGVTAADVLVKVVDVRNVAQANIPVVVRSSRNGGPELIDTIASQQQKTNAAGEFHATLTTRTSSTLGGDAVLTVDADGKRLDQTTTVTFRSLVNASLAKLLVTPVQLPANGITSGQIVAEIKGEAGQPLPGVFVRLETRDDTIFRLQPQTGRTDANGIFRSRISSLVPGSTFIDLIADGLRTSASVFVVFL